MNRKWMKGLLPALLLSLTVYGCDSVSESRLTGPSEGPDEILIETVVNGVHIVWETDGEVGTVSGTFNETGGMLALGKHAMIIPAGAVSGPTVFKMAKRSGALKFDLTATSPGSLFLNNVGGRGFAKPIKLAISYEGTSITDPTRTKIVQLKLLGTETQPSTLDTYKRWVVGELSHFSDYALVDF